MLYPERLKRLLEKTSLSSDDVHSRMRSIRKTVLCSSPTVRTPHFDSLTGDDLRHLFETYDRLFFDEFLSALANDGTDRLGFRVSGTMTVSGGSTRLIRNRRRSTQAFEIVVSSLLLFQTFPESDSPPVPVAGIPCRDPLDALQRIVEHEVIHLAELLVWQQSSCRAPRFRSIARRLFAHTESSHQMLTPREKAFRDLGIRLGDRVSFDVAGRQLAGIVNRITKRATVLVEEPGGRMYSDGKRYAKFYVPLPRLTRLATTRVPHASRSRADRGDVHGKRSILPD